MRVLNVRNVHEALPLGLRLLSLEGIQRGSRNGPVLQAPWPITTVYNKPCERVIFWPSRDANPFFHLYESLWMIQGRDDVAPLNRYVKKSADYSDDGVILHGAYGYRWRHGKVAGHFDQLPMIAKELTKNPESRRCVLQMWESIHDLGRSGKDFPCNTIATLQRDDKGALDLTVFCRSNDLIWGCCGANAVQFSILLEYMARWIGCPVGVYRQISVNYHAYLNTYNTVTDLVNLVDEAGFLDNPYAMGRVYSVPMPQYLNIDAIIDNLIYIADRGFVDHQYEDGLMDPWAKMVYAVLKAHEVYRVNIGRERYGLALEVLSHADQKADWVVAAREWLLRRELAFVKKQEKQL